VPAPVIRLGCAGWSYKDWDGTFYPKGLPAAQQLGFYAQEFDCVEIDSTFYAIPAVAMVNGWAAKTPEGFLFSPKFPRVVTHDKELHGADAEVGLYLERMCLLGEKLGPMLIQMAPSFRAAHFERTAQFLQRLPRQRPDGGRLEYAIEFRHRSWATEETQAMLRERGVCLAAGAADVGAQGAAPRLPSASLGTSRSGSPSPALPVTADFAYVRFLGRRDRINKFDAIQIDRSCEHAEWLESIRNLVRNTGRVFAFWNNHWAGHSPQSVRDFRQLLHSAP